MWWPGLPGLWQIIAADNICIGLQVNQLHRSSTVRSPLIKPNDDLFKLLVTFKPYLHHVRLDDHDHLTISETGQTVVVHCVGHVIEALAIEMTTKSDIYSATCKGRYDPRGVDRSVLSFLIQNLMMVWTNDFLIWLSIRLSVGLSSDTNCNAPPFWLLG